MRGRTASAVALIIGLVVASTGCELGPSPAAFTITTTVDGADADPGDGVCEATDGAGDCTVRAAVDEANALAESGEHPETLLTVPDGAYTLASGLTVHGRLGINDAAAGAVTLITDSLHVASGAQLRLTGVSASDLVGSTSQPLRVDGTLIAHRSAIGRFWYPTIDVGPSGILVAENTIVSSGAGGGIRNAGLTVLRHVTVSSSIGNPTDAPYGLEAIAGGMTGLASTTLLSLPGPKWLAGRGIACGGTAPVSFGYNTAWDASCGFTGPGDLSGVNPYEQVSGFPPATSVLVDAVPAGVNGCGTEVVTDRQGRARPVDGNGDDVAACDIGSLERPAPLP